jgi:hypothetical protein
MVYKKIIANINILNSINNKENDNIDKDIKLMFP